ncbi:MAG TPA: sigma-54 dependent transcriptional regulator [bacterium]|nr:sigma-54 dependent transcriptional regulator [bacterium]
MRKEPTSLLPGESFLPEGLHRPPNILVVDDDSSIRKLLHFHLRRSGCLVTTVEDGEGALRHVEQVDGVDLCLLDLRLSGRSGLDTLKALNATGKVGCVIVMTAFGTMADAVTALKEGAYDFVNKTHSFDDVRMAIRNALHTIGLREEVEQLRMRLHEESGDFGEVIGTSLPFQRVMKLVRKVKDSNITVLIQGESGTGKELIARAIHFEGQYRKRPFVAINCAAIPENLLESELFGHEKGAFTGAGARRIGRFEEAHEGTLFLDEIGELSPALQAKLLRVLQTGEIQPIGGQVRHVKVRVISATNQNLLRAVEEGRFRQDLYYRLAVFPIDLPPLRERKDDIPALVDHFIKQFRSQEQKPVRGVASEALDRLIACPWYGNVRELENVIYRAVVLAETPILSLKDFPSLPPPAEEAVQHQAPAAHGAPPASPAEAQPAATDTTAAPASAPAASAAPVPLPEAVESASPGAPALPTLEQAEVQAIRHALATTGGNMSRAAVQLKIGRATLYRKSKKYGLLRP